MNTQSNIDLRSVAEEGINFPTSIQPHGVLLVLKEPELTILQVSENVNTVLDYAPNRLLNQPLSSLLEASPIETIKKHLADLDLQRVNPLKLKIGSPHSLSFTGMIHRHNGCLILELEQSSSPGISNNPFDFYHFIKRSSTALNYAETLEDICQIAVRDIQTITGFDRVMLYKFHEDNHGSVITEAKRDGIKSYLGLHYPDLDIPEKTRKMFLKHWLRFINNVSADPVELVPNINPLTQNKTDLQLSGLRSSSSCHLQYLSNMGVHSSMTISLIKDRKLWGLIACHHYSDIWLSYEQRAACEFLGQSLSLELVHKEHNEDYEYQLYLKDIQSSLLESMSNAENYMDGLVKNQQNLLNLVNARGVAICLGDRHALIGETPDISIIQQLIENIEYYMGESRFFSTTCLSQIDPQAELYKNVASGVLAIEIGGSKNQYIIWFRPEVLQTINWAGNPEDSVQKYEDNRAILCPRKSFDLWKETVELKSLDWKECEINAALSLRQSIIKIILKKADELSQLNRDLQESEAQARKKSLQLQQTLQDLKQAQMHLVQSEKMSSLGQLVAGIAHEINNPVNFIYGNLSHADNYIEDLLSIVKNYQEHYPDPPEEIQDQCEDADLEFLVEDLPKLLNSMQIGADRIREIVRSLRNFSRLDESETKAVDIHEGIDSTLLILNNRIKAKSDRPAIQIIKNYGDLPAIECYPSQLNQVLMNLIANAIDALEEGNIKQNLSYQDLETHPNQITITTTLCPQFYMGQDWISIELQDNGLGIPEDVQSKLFDPFFTTKPIGKGTGMGLAISYQIVVDKHQGNFTCRSQLGEGTTFRIEIPVKPSLFCSLVPEQKCGVS